MKYGAKEVLAMTTEELWTASLALQKTLDDRNELRNSAKYKRRFAKQLEPGINPAFLQLKNEIDSELKNRNENNGD